jgi:hypothetical protein
MLRRFVYITTFAFLLQIGSAVAGSTGSESLKKSGSQSSAPECFEGVSRPYSALIMLWTKWYLNLLLRVIGQYLIR